MRPALIAACVLLSSCGYGRDVRVRWTVDGQPAASACTGTAEKARVVVHSRDTYDDPEPAETLALSTCADGETVVTVGRVATIQVELLSGDVVVGKSAEVPVSPALLADPAVIDLDAHVVLATLVANLTVAGRGCGDVGAASFDVSLARVDGAVETETLDEQTVTCEGNDAAYAYDGVTVGARYAVHATTTTSDGTFATEDQSGHVFYVDDAHEVITVDLRAQ